MDSSLPLGAVVSLFCESV